MRLKVCLRYYFPNEKIIKQKQLTMVYFCYYDTGPVHLKPDGLNQNQFDTPKLGKLCNHTLTIKSFSLMLNL